MGKAVYILSVFIYAVWAIDVFSVVGLFNGAFLSEKNHFKNVSLSYMALSFFLIFLSSVLSARKFKTLLAIFTLPLSVINLFIVWYCLYYGSLIGSDDVSAVFSTNIQETKEFILTVLDYRFAAAVLISAAPYPLIYFMRPFKITSRVLLAVMLILPAMIVLLTYDKRWVIREIAALKIYDTYSRTEEDRARFFALLEETSEKEVYFDNISGSLNNDNDQIFVLVISESQNRLHFSVYGYNRETTPFLRSIADDLYIFSDINSAAVYTNASVEKMITFADNHNDMQGYESGDLIRFFKDAGFKTYWLSNQYYLGPHDSLYSAIAYKADEAVFLNKISSFFLETESYDEALLPYFDKILKDKDTKKKFVVLHLIGSHAPYEMRYPEGRGSFGWDMGIKDVMGGISKQKDIATYDNSIEYTDSILKDIISGLKASGDDSYLLFLSDHGVDVYDTYPDKSLPRSNSTLSPSMYQIPFIVWLSESYKNNYPGVAERMKKALNRRYQTDRVIHTIIDLSRLQHHFYAEEDSVISDNYTEKPVIINGAVIGKDGAPAPDGYGK